MAARPLTPLAVARETAGYTQEALAVTLKVERTTIGRWERGVQSPQPWQRRGLATALQVSLDVLDDLLRRTLRRPAANITTVLVSPSSSLVTTPIEQIVHQDGPEPEADVIHAAIPRLRRALDRLDLPDDGPTGSPDDLHGEIIRASDDRLQSRYGNLARRLPDLIAELARAGQLGDAAGQRHAASLLTLALRAADGVAFKFGYLDLSARLIDLMRSAAQIAEDPLLLAAVAYVRTETFFATGDLDTAARALELAADHVPDLDTTSSLAAFGALHMRAAVVAGRAGKADLAADHLREARRAAARRRAPGASRPRAARTAPPVTSAAATLAGVRFMHPATDGLTIPDPIPDASIFQPAPWVAPSSEQLPFLRRRLHEHYTTIAAEGAQQGRTGQVARAAAVESEDREVRRYARDEADRLQNATLTWVDHEAIEMAVTYSSTPSTEPARPDRMPSMTGFMLFETCIGGALYDAARAQDLPGSGWTPAPWLYDVSGYVEAPIVAISWSRLPPPHEDRAQLSFYTPNRPPHWDSLPPDTFVAQWASTKTRYSAGYFADHVRTVSARMSPMPVLATFTATLQFGELLPEPDANHCAGWVQTVYGLWQLLDHKVKKPLTQTDVIAAPRSVTRGDARAGITATSAVNIVRVHPRKSARLTCPPLLEASVNSGAGAPEPGWPATCW